ncbi:LCP family protein [Streptomyces uncialis]|uniref:LytR family transcriptional regulator n=1 Tax=Streptomyces uncialis TaxID=1048205 RepID=A0A1Q4V1T0_9ACTN|nr:LCP family protein [Streptomyces uncialis]OKH91771.1 LytR family transcriptional regulator [Streptomyces uncialis]
MDAQGHGRGDDIDPADQWVLNPETGDYELRLDSSPEQSSVPTPRRAPRPGAARAPGPRQPSDPAGRRASRGERPGQPGSRSRSSAPSRDESGTRDLPGQRRRRAAPPEPPDRRRGKAARKRPPKKSRGKRVLIWGSGALAVVLVGAGTSAYLYLEHLNSNIKTTDVGSAGAKGFSKDKAVNILVIGTDKRTGEGNGGYGDKNSAGHADTTLLLHVSKDRSNATVMSIPRDLITDIPDCPTKQSDGSTKVVPGSVQVRFNTSLGQGGRDAGCAMRTVTELTGVQVDHFMLADFDAVKTLTSAVGGVEVCVAKDIDDPKSHLKLSAGKHTIEGEQALAFVRTRDSFGNRSDLDRIQVQQQFLGSLMRKLKSDSTLSSPTKMLDLAEAATKALEVDTGIGSINKLKDVGLEMKKVNPKNITFTTLPVEDNPAEEVPTTVVVEPVKAEPLFAMIRDDVSLTEVKQQEKADAKKAKAAQAKLLEGPKSDPAEVRVNVYNGGAPAGSAQETLTWLQNNEGVLKSTQLGNAPAEVAKTQLAYAPDQADQARRLAEVMGLPASAMKPGESEENAQGLPAIVLTLGKDFKGAGVPVNAPTKAPEGIQKVEADKAVCSE